MFDCFHVVGKQPVEMNLLNSLVTEAAILGAVVLKLS